METTLTALSALLNHSTKVQILFPICVQEPSPRWDQNLNAKKHQIFGLNRCDSQLNQSKLWLPSLCAVKNLFVQQPTCSMVL